MGAIWLDLPYGLRGLRRNAGLTAVAVLTLVLGIGANAAIFQLVDGVLPNEIHKTRRLQQVIGWRFYPKAKGKPPFCTCKFCPRQIWCGEATETVGQS